MAGRAREKELARQRLERQARRRAEAAARRRQRGAIVGSVLAVLLVIGGVAFIAANNDDGQPADVAADATPSADPAADPSADPAADPSAPASPEPATSADARPVACGASQPPAPSNQQFPAEPPLTVDASKDYTMTLQTSCGPIGIDLLEDQAPRTVNTLAFLAEQNFYAGSPCHRMVQTEGLSVLQCGDPTGTGSGGPGFTIAEENLEGAQYTRGVVAMAKTSAPNSTSSQFFLVARDSQLPPEYTVVGQMNADGLAVLDRLMSVNQDGANGPGDGAPLHRIYLDQVQVTAA